MRIEDMGGIDWVIAMTARRASSPRGAIAMLTVFFALVMLACSGAESQPVTPETSSGTDDPAFWLAKIEDSSTRTEALRNLDEILRQRLSEAGGFRDDPMVEGYLAQVTESLMAAYHAPYMTEGGEDLASRDAIVELLALTEDVRAVPVFEGAVKTVTEERIERAITSAGALTSLCQSPTVGALFIPPPLSRTKRWRENCSRGASSVPLLLTALEAVRAQRRARGPNAANTVEEDHLTKGVVEALGTILLGNPNHQRRDEVIGRLVEVLETSDELQDLRINMVTLQLLGRIGDNQSIPVLVRALFMQGKRRPVALQEIARVSIMHIEDLDAMALALVKAGRMEDEALLSMQQADPSFDPRLIKEQVAVTLGKLGIRSKVVIDYLTEELEHSRPDAFDRLKSRGPVIFSPEQSKGFRRMFAAQALGRMRHEPSLPTILKRMRIRPSKNGIKLVDPSTQGIELPGYMDAARNFFVPEKTNETILNIIGKGDDALSDRAGLILALQAGPKLADGLVELVAELESCEEEELPQCLRANFEQRYIPALQEWEGCITLECHVEKLADSREFIRERAAYQIAILAYTNATMSISAREALLDALERERSMEVVWAISFALDRLSPHGPGRRAMDRLEEIVVTWRGRPVMNTSRRAIEGLLGRLAYRTRAAEVD